VGVRTFCATNIWRKEDLSKPAQDVTEKEPDKKDDWFNNQIDNAIGEQKEIQARTPWHREGAEQPPVKRNRIAGAMTKGMIYHPFHAELQLTRSLQESF
jgi:hypothetical protein